ncbi:MAG TPA: SGNH/GDSL hydrolase family protein [Puia sp.]
MKTCVILFLTGLFTMTEVRAAGHFRETSMETRPFPKKVHRILFLGNSITYGGKYIVDIEAYFATRYPKKHYEFINVGLPSETVSGLSEPNHADGKFPRPDLHERLARVLALTKPDLVFACYGMNDGIYLPFEEERFRKFREGILWLHQEVVQSGAVLIHLTPPVYDEQKGGRKGYATVLDRYSEWLLQQKDSLGWKVADLHFPMRQYLEEHQLADSSFALAQDGIHPDSLGHWIMAREILYYLGEKKVRDAESIQAALAGHPQGAAILALVGEKQQVMKDAWLTAARHTRPGMNVGMPLEQARVKESEIAKEIGALQRK